ncbi:MAG: 5-nucleotidase [Firmicutes bacterium]|nr:5-nucleotidase [Bacillota bacterium]
MRMMFKSSRVFAVGLISLLLLAGQVADAESSQDSNLIHLEIITVNDFHGALEENGKNPGAGKLVAFLAEAKAKNPEGTLLMSAGDMFEGTPDSNLLYGKTVVDIMNYAKFDVMTLGNHEFDWGVKVLKERIAQSKFPYVCANVIDRKTGKLVDFVKPYTIVERKGVRIAVIGIATPETAYKTNPKMVSCYSFEDPVKVVNALVPKLKQRGVDVIVVLSHLGSWMEGSNKVSGNAAELAAQANGIDGIVSGHSHMAVSGKVKNVPVVQANYNGRAVGKIEFLFNKRSRQVVASDVSVTSLPFKGLVADTKVQAILRQAQMEIAPVKNVVLGQMLHELGHDRNELAETLLGQWVTDTMRQAVGADIAFQNSGGLRTGISKGAVTMGNLYEVIPFDNTLFTMVLTGKQIMGVLEYGIMNDKIGMVQYSGMKVAYDLKGAKGGRIIAVTMADGTPLSPEKSYKVVTNDFMATGGDGFIMFKEGQNFHDTCIPERDILADAIRKQKVIDFSGDDRWNVLTLGQEQKDAA